MKYADKIFGDRTCNYCHLYTRIGGTKITVLTCMAESTRMGSGKIGGENVSVCQPNAMTYHLVVLGKSYSQTFQQILMAYELGNGMPTSVFLRQLS